ncbi:hypothetical protein Aduo_000504 [Ancylostoma duodenale]
MRVKKCPKKIVVVELEHNSSTDESAASDATSVGRVASAGVRKYERDDDEMPALHPEVVPKGESPVDKVLADVSSIHSTLSSRDRLRLKRRRDVHMEEAEFLKCIANGFPGIQLRNRHTIIEAIKSELVQPAAKRRKKEFVKRIRPSGTQDATRKTGRPGRLRKNKEDDKLQQSVMNILKEAQQKMTKKVADDILKQRVEFGKLWGSRLRKPPAVQSDVEKGQSAPPVRTNVVEKKSFTRRTKILEKNTHCKKQVRPQKHPAKSPGVTLTTDAALIFRERSHRTVKPVERYGVALEQRQARKRKKVARVEDVKEKKKTGPKKPFRKAQDNLAKEVPQKRQKVSANEKFPSSHAARLPRQCRKDCAAHEDTVVDERSVDKGTMDKTLVSGGVGDGLGTGGEDLNFETDVAAAVIWKKESPRKRAPTTTLPTRKAGCSIAKTAVVPQRKITLDRRENIASMQREKVFLAKAQEREAKRAAREAKRQMKLEEQQKKREARRLKKELREKLVKERRERREAERKKLEEERLARKKKKKGTTGALKIVEEAQKVYISSPCDDVVPIADLSFCYRIFVSGKVFLNRWLILDEIPSHRYGVAAYLVVENTEEKTQGILYAQDVNNPFAGLPEEVYFLQTQSERNRSYMFQTVIDAHFISATAQSPTFFYYVVILRESASLKDIWTHYPEPTKESGEKKAWSPGTVGRLASDILSIIEVAYEAGYTFRNIDMSHFHLDVRTRRLYLDNAIEVVVSTELKELRLTNGEYVSHNYWRGCVEYAPLSWHQRGRESIMRVADCAEVLFYMMVDMLGLLTWRGLDDRQIMVCKEGFVEQNRKKLPVPLIDYWKVVRRAQAIDTSKFRRQDDYLLLDGMRGGATVSVLDFRTLFMRLLTMYKVFGGVLDEDTPYDFEVVDDPTKRSPDQQRLVELFQEAEFLRYKLEVLKADYDALMTRKEFVKRNAAQTKRERALAMQHRHDPKDHVQNRRDAGDFSSEESDDE